MAKRIDPNLEPYRPILVNPKGKTEELFNLITAMDTQQIKQFSIINSIPLNINEGTTGENLIHKVLKSDNLLKKEFHRLNVIKFLVQNGVNPDQPNSENQTPLHLACKQQYNLITEYLISLGVNGNFQDNNGLTPLHYALQGKIELYEEPKEPKEFIQKPKLVDFEKKDSLLELKKLIWEKIKDEPFLKLLSNTIDKSIFSDVNIKKMSLDLTKKITTEGLKTDTLNNRKFLKENIEIIRNEIENIIKKKWSNFPELGDLEIHEKTEDSFQIPENDLSPLKNINIKSNIKKLAIDSKNNIKALCESVKVDNYDIDEKYMKELGKFYKQFTDENKSKFNKIPSTLRDNHENTKWIVNNISDTNWIDFNISKMVSNSIDFADNIIDWDQLTFIGGSRYIKVMDVPIDIITKIKYIKREEDKILNILIFGLDIPRQKYLDLSANLINIDNIKYDKVILAYNTIFNKPIITPTYLNGERRNFFEKWKNLLATKNIASVLYCMYSAYMCLESEDNLTCIFTSIFSALIHAISSDKNLNNAFKKYYIMDIIENKELTINEQLIKMIEILLDNNLPKIEGKINNLIAINNNLQEKTTQINSIIKDIVSQIEIMNSKPYHSDVLNVITLLNGFENISDNYIPFNKQYMNNTKNYDSINKFEKIIYILKRKQSSDYFQIINQYLETLVENDPIKATDIDKHAESKLIEASHLGLYYLGLIPGATIISPFIIIKEKEKQAEQEIIYFHPTDPPHFTFKLDEHLENGNVPIIGNYLILKNDMQLNETQKFNYFHYDEIKCRPPTEFAVKLLKERNQNYYNRILKYILTEHKYNLNKIIDDNKELAKAFTYIYPIIAVLAELLEFYNSEHVNTIEKIIQELNKYNGYVLLYYFLLSPDKLVKIPKFNYYEIPSLKKSGKFLYFDSSDEINLDINPHPPTVIDGSGTIINEPQTSVIYNQGITSYKTFMTNIMQNILKGKYIIKKEALVFSKEQDIPPSIAPILGEFYKYNLKQIILNTSSKIDREIIITVGNIFKEIDIGNKEVTCLFTICKLTEELVKEQVTSYTKKQIYEVLKIGAELKGELELTIKPSEYPVLLNKTNFSIDELTKEQKEDIFFYQFSKVNIKAFDCNDSSTTNFIIYPEEYATTELLKSKYALKINYKLYENLLDSDINPFIIDSNDQTAIFPVLKLHMNEIISNLKKRIDYRDYSEINVFDFLKNECNNHLEKLTNNKNEFVDWINYFVCYQKYEVLTLILSNDKFGNNIPTYLEDSFNVICYITNQYISESIHKIENFDHSTLQNIPLFSKKYNLEDFAKYLFINENLNNLNEYDTDEDNYISDLIKNKESEIKKLEKDIEKISKGRTRGNLETTIINISNEINALKRILTGSILTSQQLNNTKIIERYKEMTPNIGTLTNILSRMIKLNNLNDSYDLLTFRFYGLEKVIINNISDININLTLLDTISQFYIHTNKVSEMYFTFGKYTENNKVLEFTKELLIFINKQFIIFPYIMAIKKILFEYFKNMYPTLSPSDINNRVKYCFQKTILLEENNENYIEELLYNEINERIVENATNIFKNSEKESQFNLQTVKEILDNVTNLFTINTIIPISEDSIFYKQIKEVNNYFDSFTNRTILNWQAIIENTFKFNINQGRIINSIYSVLKAPVS